MRQISRVLGFAVAIPLLLTSCGYNNIQTYDETAAQAKQNIEVQLQRRADLIGNLVETVKGVAQQESEVLTQVTQARAGLTGALSKPGGAEVGELAAANEQLTAAASRISVVVEAYPQLRSNEAFMKLQDELSGTENRVAVSRTDYNAAVKAYNEYIRKFPQTLTAKVSGAKPRPYFEVTNAGAREAPKVDFGKPPATR
ncbi:MAG: LemA family protein [Phycisphaerae bacterium]|nr:LemA family protein [Gemmatimonadaceae bacterium]